MQVGLGCIRKLAEHEPVSKPVIESKVGQNQSQRSKNDNYKRKHRERKPKA